MSVEVMAFLHAASNTYSYLVACTATGNAAIIDPALDYDSAADRVETHSAQTLLDAIDKRGWQLRWLLETHAHADHLSASWWLRKQRPQARIGIGRGIIQVQQTLAPNYPLPTDFRCDGSQFDVLFDADQTFPLGSLQVKVIAVPGHTPDSIAYLIDDALFPGDSIFMPDAGTARCDFPGGDAEALFTSIQRLLSLPGETRVYVCHDYGPGGRALAYETTIARQRAENIHVHAGAEAADFVAQRRQRDASLPTPRLLAPAMLANLRAGWHRDLELGE